MNLDFMYFAPTKPGSQDCVLHIVSSVEGKPGERGRTRAGARTGETALPESGAVRGAGNIPPRMKIPGKVKEWENRLALR